MNKGYLNQHAGLLEFILRLGDLVVVLSSAIVAFWIRFPETLYSYQLPLLYWLAILLLVVAFYAVFAATGIYKAWRGNYLVKEISLILFSGIVVVLILATLSFLTKTGADFSRLWFAYTISLSLLLIIVLRLLVRFTLRWARVKGFNQKNVVILGAGSLGRKVVSNIHENKWSGLNVIGYFDDDTTLHGDDFEGVTVLGDIDEVFAYIEEYRQNSGETEIVVDQVWITLPLKAEKRFREVYAKLQNTSVSVSFVPDVFGMELLNYSMDIVTGIPILNLSGARVNGIDGMMKIMIDKLIAGVLLVVSLPLMIIICISIKLDSSGPIIFKQRRYGISGKEITVWKFRTMNVLETEGQVSQATKNDSRVTRVGRILRKTSIDEWPQLINVLQGRMSIVGPRPHASSHNEQFRQKLNGYMVRHQMRPGITGLSQIKGYRGEILSNEQLEKRLEYDLQYLEKWSLWLDFKIMFVTLFKGFVHSKAY